MTDEEKKVEVYSNHKECCCMLFCKFLMITSAVFVGTLLALLVAKALMQPKFPPCPFAMMRHYRPGIERQIPPPPQLGERPMHKHHFKGDKPNFAGDKIPNKFEKRK